MAVEESGNRAVRRRNRQQMCHFPSITSSEDKFGQSGKPLSDSTGTENLLLCFLLVFRILNAFTIKTFFVPDEFWQGPEIAHRLVFGYGYLTWEWKEGLRGWTVPLIYATGYKLLACLGLDSSTTIGVAPRIIQSILASFGDLFLYKLAVQRFGRQTGAWALICHLLSWFTFYSVPRTLTNSLETVFTTIALYYWPHSAKEEVNTKRIIKALGYFTQGFPVVMLTHLIPFVGGVLKAAPHQRALAWLILWIISIYSFLGHKEFRFIFPVVPLAMCYCGLFLSKLSGCQLEKTQTADQCALNISQSEWKAKLLVLFLAASNVPMALYTSTVHQRGTIDVMNFIRDESSKLTTNDGMSVLFLMPCHSTPFYSYVHRNISMRILECPPSGEEGYVDEADQFYLNPSSWLQKEFGNHTGHGDPAHLPSHIVMYNVLSPDVALFLGQFQYSKSATFFHTHFPEGRVGSQVFVFRHIPRHS
ncbi:GPI mannosyltransferase 3-like isoform X3 [Montipora foliosa]|uniref:GPI mannosyltransferase 3-like isoform X3 n=1 Tax=Montipora foliosa TaxID=591990 RepID=UPI0035F1350D